MLRVVLAAGVLFDHVLLQLGFRGLFLFVVAVFQLQVVFDHLPHSPVVLGPVLLVELRGVCVGGRLGVRVVEQRLDRDEDVRHVVHGAPVRLEDV